MERPAFTGDQNQGPRIFETTLWSVVIAAGKGGSGESQAALETLCRAYWYPIYLYVRRKGHDLDDAQDLTQEFFNQLIRKEFFRLADQSKGRFRSFLLASLDYFLAREWSRAHRQKRGGQYSFVSMNETDADDVYRFEPVDDRTPEEAYEKHWAMTVLKQTMNALDAECKDTGKSALFEQTRHLLSGEKGGEAYGEICTRVGMSEGALRVAIHRLRQRYAELLRREIGKTVDEPEEVDEEIRFLLSVVSR